MRALTRSPAITTVTIAISASASRTKRRPRERSSRRLVRRRGRGWAWSRRGRAGRELVGDGSGNDYGPLGLEQLGEFAPGPLVPVVIDRRIAPEDDGLEAGAFGIVGHRSHPDPGHPAHEAVDVLVDDDVARAQRAGEVEAVEVGDAAERDVGLARRE